MQARPISYTDYLYILGTVLFTVYGQIVLKWQMSRVGALPAPASEKVLVLGRLLLNPWIIMCVLAGLLALVSWMAALTRFQLTYAYPFVSTTFALVLILSAMVSGESLTIAKIAGVALIMLGVFVGARG